MTEPSSPSSSPKRPSRGGSEPGVPRPATMPDAAAARDSQGHFTQDFRLAAVRYALACGLSQRAAARAMGLSDKTLSMWINDARPDAAGRVDGPRFDELAQLRTQNREQLARIGRLTAERDFLKKCAGYFATPTSGGSK